MMLVPVEIRPSTIHGAGLFALQPIAAGTRVWHFGSGDARMPLAEADAAVLHFGYINPANPNFVVTCGDAARFWNFEVAANCWPEYPPTATEEAPIVAVRDIAPGEELTIAFSSDADWMRKIINHHAL